mmetsp:Transcript_95525/g.309517  ORF Transcript_95525/g.309517 Transcript_95525/m.309517 type:complete len:163 (+) Transcript_95525:3-491(+)
MISKERAMSGMAMTQPWWARKADHLHKRRPSGTPQAEKPKAPARTACTDRAARLREGRGMQKVLSGDSVPSTEWGEHVDCSRDVCKPFNMNPAGNPSHLVHSIKDYVPHILAGTAAKGRQNWQARMGDAPRRSGMAMVLDPRDPLLPQLLTLCMHSVHLSSD